MDRLKIVGETAYYLFLMALIYGAGYYSGAAKITIVDQNDKVLYNNTVYGGAKFIVRN